jgi:hypothetical protein
VELFFGTEEEVVNPWALHRRSWDSSMGGEALSRMSGRGGDGAAAAVAAEDMGRNEASIATGCCIRL